MRYFIQTILLLTFLLVQLALAADKNFSFTESIDALSNYEKDIVGVGVLDKSKSDEIRQALVQIFDESEAQLASLDLQISNKRDRLAALLEEPASAQGVGEGSERASNAPVLDPLLLRNKEALEIDLVTLETAHRKASLVRVYANDLIVQLAAQTSKQNQQKLLYKAPSLFSPKTWQTAIDSIPEASKVISADIMQWVVTVLLVGALLIFGLGPFLHRQFSQSYHDFIPTRVYPRWSFLGIFVLVLIANCFYFVFVAQGRYLEFTFLILVALNLALAILLLRLLNKVHFASRELVIDGELVVQERHLFVFFIALVKLLTVLAMIAVVAGYSVLSMYVLHNTVITLTAMMLFLCLRALWLRSEKWWRTEKQLSDEKMQLTQPPVDASGPKSGRSLLMLTFVELGLAVVLFLVAVRFWGVSLNNFEGQSSLMRGEFKVGSLTIEFSQLLSSMFAFLLVFYFFKLIRWFLRERVFSAMRLSVSASEAVLAIIGYIGFSAAIIASLNALGVQWENLAIIAGALSVGIGFGLQTIINNFVSGLILLFERPVRVGDWVILGNGLEGHIKKVNMRSTEVLTLERSSVLIPNSNLLSDTITNWTLNDKMGRQDISVGVAYGSDTEQVKQVLLAVAAEHNLLRKYPSPQVLFRDFGDSSLDFILRVFLQNIDDRHRVSSDLRFAIDKAFRQHDIIIPFPQRDLHIIDNDSQLEGGRGKDGE